MEAIQLILDPIKQMPSKPLAERCICVCCGNEIRSVHDGIGISVPNMETIKKLSHALSISAIRVNNVKGRHREHVPICNSCSRRLSGTFCTFRLKDKIWIMNGM